MSMKLYNEENIQAIADAIREKNGSTDTYKVSQMAEAIRNIGSGARLPKEYQEVEYIESSGTQYINTGYKPTNTTTIEIFFNPIGLTNNAMQICGTMTSWQNGAALVAVVGSPGGQNKLELFNSSDIYSNASTNINFGKNQIISYKNGVWYRDGVILGSMKQPYANGYDYLLLAMREGNGIYANGSKKLYYCKIYSDVNSETLVRDFVPCYRKSDNYVGLYDLVTKQFYPNAGSGTFTMGGEV